MKRVFFLWFLAAYILVCCTVTSTWVEKQMTLSGRCFFRRGNHDAETIVEIPLWMGWNDGSSIHLFYTETVTDEDGAERYVVREYGDRDFSVRREDEILEVYATGEIRILYAATRFPLPGEAVILQDAEPSEHTVLVYAPDESYLDAPTGSSVETLAYSDSARLLRVKANVSSAEKELTHLIYPAEDRWLSLRAIDLSDATAFLKNLPYVCAAALLITVGLGWTLWAWCCRRGRLLVLPFLAPAGVWLLLRNCTLPGTLLPDTNILDFTHYQITSTMLRQTGLAPDLVSLLRASLQQAKMQCIILMVTAVLLILFPMLTALIRFYRAKYKKLP